MNLAECIRNVPDFPIAGIQFKDVTTLLKDPEAFAASIETFLNQYADQEIDVVVGIESRGFIWGGVLAYEMGAAFVPVRKPGKLPAETVKAEYTLEYGTNALEMHRDAIQPGQNVLVLDDLLATGGTAKATCELVEQLGGEVVGVAFLIELTFLNGREQLAGYDVFTLIQMDD
ncbi:MAG: adenine phosphoribosyltransferase [Anaerolineae bacterium]|nr:adenine phosphoribosyltransferase [Anaerolineae bacterium]